MKANLKGMGGIKGLLLMHGEKAGIAVVGLLALGFVYSSLNLPRLDDSRQASHLEQEINQTKSTVDQSKWPSPDSELAPNVRFAKEIAKSADPIVEPEPYVTSGAGFTPVIPPTTLRTDPSLHNAVDVRAIGGSGLFAFVDEEIRKAQELKRAAEEQQRARMAEKQAQEQQQQMEEGRQVRRGREQAGMEMGAFEVDPNHPNRRLLQGMTSAMGVPLQGGERIERAYWATVVAKVPIRKQLDEYQDAFQNARGYDPANDFPRYKGYMVQRSEVVRGKPLEWKAVAVYDAQRQSIVANKPIGPVVSETAVSKLMEIASTMWAGQPMEPVDPRYLDPVLTLPLPPLVGREWGADATHPDIPLAINAPPMEEQFEPLVEEPVEQQVDPNDPEAAFRTDPNRQPMLGSRPGGFGPGMGRMPFPGGERGFSRGYGEGGGRFMGGEMGRGERYSPGLSAMSGQRVTLPRGVDYLLLRFFDYTVEPGKKYKYRVKLVLADPNYGLPDNALEPAVQDRLRANKKRDFRLVEEWSEPSPTVGIPVVGMVQIVEVKPPSGRTFNDEPTVKLMVEQFDVDAEGIAIHIAKEKDFRRGYVINLNEEMDYTGDGDRWIDTYDSYKIQTGVTALDVAGGQRLTKDITAPGRVLLMDPSGELSIRKELDDSMSVEYLQLLFAKPDKRREGEEGMMRGEMMFMPGGPGGGFPGRRER
ncbi:MAG: hypothetical protein WD738_07125 [Pirellulales bacterium]